MRNQLLLGAVFVVLLATHLCVAETKRGSLLEHMSYDDVKDYEDHPCKRECQDNMPPMVCEYDFLLEHYHTLTKACYNCPHNITDCDRPHCIAADGLSRGLLVVNRMMPGPGIHVCEHDTVRVRVHNKLDMAEGTSIHWHGILQQGSPHMDGVGMVTQCPIPVHTSFTYTFKADNAGTHFWHSHSGMQRGDGIFGAFIIRQAPSQEPHKDKYDFDLPEHHIIVNDWLKRETAASFAYHHHSVGDNKPSSMLINGKGIYQWIYDPETNQNSSTPREEFFVNPGKRYRFRIISNGILNCPIAISIDDHTMTIIATDGSPVEPVDVQTLNVFAGERYDFILEANQPVQNYLIRTIGMADCGKQFKGAAQTAILRYTGSTQPPPAWMNPMPAMTGRMLNPVNEKGTPNKLPVTELRSLVEDDPAVTREPDKRFTVGMDFRFIDNPRFHNHLLYPMEKVDNLNRLLSPQMNNITMSMPSYPALTQLQDIPEDLFCNNETIGRDCGIEFCECIHHYRVDLGDVVEVLMVDEGRPFDANHPTHLHGHGFRVIGLDRVAKQTSAKFIMAMDERGEITRNLNKPVVKDTVTVPDGGYTLIRFYADNPGIWFFHCHIEYHSEIGMGLLFQVGDPSEFPETPPRFPRCGNWDLYYEAIEADTAIQSFTPNRILALLLIFIAVTFNGIFYG